MTALRMALTELRRLSAGRLPKIALLALILVPTLYGGLYLYANHDPYGNLKNVPAALVVDDTGSTVDGKRLNAGDDVADELIKGEDFGWQRVDASAARAGVRDGRYDFALIIPADFSRALTSPARFDPEQAQLQMVTNDANSYLSTTIAGTVTSKVKEALSARVGAEAAEQFLHGLTSIRGALTKAAQGADRLVSGLGQARSGAHRLATGATKLESGADTLDSGLGTLADRTSSLPSDTRRLADGAAKVAAGDREIAGVGRRIADLSSTLRGDYNRRRVDLQRRMDQLGLDASQQEALLAVYDDLGDPVRRADDKVQSTSDKLDQLAGGAGQVASGADKLADATPQLVDGIARAHEGAGQLSDGAGTLSDGADTLAGGLTKLHRGARELATGLHDGVDQIPALDDATQQRIARTIGNPVDIRSSSQAEAGSYGAGLAPFFMALAAWIGGYVLFLLVRPLSHRAMAANQTPVRVALAGWLTPALIGAIQMIALASIILLAVRIVPANLPGTLAFMLLMSLSFIAIVHCLNAWLGTAGQFLGLVLMVLQLVSAGGTFPWQTIPHPLYPLHDFLPMSYAVDGLRQLMYGGMSARVAQDVLVLTLWGVGALLLTAMAARRQRVWNLKRVKPELQL